MIFTRSFLPAVGLAVSAVASDIEQLPQATPYGHKREAALPRAPAPTAAPDVSERWGRMQLFDRADGLGTDTCGFLSEGSDRPYPLTCGTGWTCTNSASFRGCCQGAGCTTSSDVFYSSCFDATSTQCRSSVDGNTLCW